MRINTLKEIDAGKFAIFAEKYKIITFRLEQILFAILLLPSFSNNNNNNNDNIV